MKNNLLLYLLIAALMLCISTVNAHSASVQQDIAQSSVIEQILKRGVLKVGMDRSHKTAVMEKLGIKREKDLPDTYEEPFELMVPAPEVALQPQGKGDKARQKSPATSAKAQS